MSNPKRSLFRAGERYRAKESFVGIFENKFYAGTTYVFLSCKYSHYDGCFVYAFRPVEGGERVEWWLPEDEPDDSWKTYFEVVE